MNANTATIRQLRTDFRSVKRKIEQHGEVIVTDHGEPAYIIKLVPAPVRKRPSLPDYYSRLRKRQPKPVSPQDTRQFWEAQRRGGRTKSTNQTSPGWGTVLMLKGLQQSGAPGVKSEA